MSSVCANFGCGRPATKELKLANGTVQRRCEACYRKKMAATRRQKK